MTLQQRAMFDLLTEFRKVADRYGLVWYAAYGTMLGAIRHSGFIPWDDDADIMLEPSSYDLLQKLSGEFSYPYFLQNQQTDPGCAYRFMKLRNCDTTCIEPCCGDPFGNHNYGVFVDVFRLTEYTPGRYANMSWGRVLPPCGFDKSLWTDPIYVPFETSSIPVPSRHDEILDICYGKDWRIPRHANSSHCTFFAPVPFSRIRRETLFINEHADQRGHK